MTISKPERGFMLIMGSPKTRPTLPPQLPLLMSPDFLSIPTYGELTGGSRATHDLRLFSRFLAAVACRDGWGVSINQEPIYRPHYRPCHIDSWPEVAFEIREAPSYQDYSTL